MILLLASEGVEKRFRETVYKKDKDEKKEPRDVKIAFFDQENTETTGHPESQQPILKAKL